MSQRSWKCFIADSPNFVPKDINIHGRSLLLLEISTVLFLCGCTLQYDRYLIMTYFGIYYKIIIIIYYLS